MILPPFERGSTSNITQSWQWVTFYDPWPMWPISQLTRDPRDPWPTHDYSPVTVTVWRLRTLARRKEVSMRFRFHTVPIRPPPRCTVNLVHISWNFNRMWAFPRKSVRFWSCLLVSGHAVTEIVKLLTDNQNNSFDCRTLLVFHEP